MHHSKLTIISHEQNDVGSSNLAQRLCTGNVNLIWHYQSSKFKGQDRHAPPKSIRNVQYSLDGLLERPHINFKVNARHKFRTQNFNKNQL